MDWQAHAACVGEDETLFFGPSRTEGRVERERREAAAKSVCAGCPVILACREHAVRAGELYGVWGGLGELERRPLLTQASSA